MFMKRSKPSPRVMPITTSTPKDSELKDRLVAISRAAREKLKPLAEINREEVRITSGPHDKLGSHESIGLLLLLAKLEPENPTDAQINDYLQASETGVCRVLEFISTCLVILTLCLSIEAPLMVYTLMTFDPADVSLGGCSKHTSGYWGGTDTCEALPFYLRWTNPQVAHGLHWAECVFMSLSLVYAFRGINLGFMLYSSFALYLPEMEDKLQFGLKTHRSLMWVWTSATMTLIWFALALPFLASRVSPVASMCSAVLIVFFIVHFIKGIMWYAMEAAKLQVDNAKRLLSEKKDTSRAEGAPSPQSSYLAQAEVVREF